MPQANTAQREPSMEEILASIRRIIEDGDATPKRGEKNGVERPPLVDFTDHRHDEPEPEMEAFRDEFAPEFDAAVAAMGIEHPIRLPEAAALMDEIEAITELPPIEAAHTSDTPRGDVHSRAANGHSAPLPEAPSEPELDANDFSELVAERRSSLISERSVRQVAASFGELSDAFAASRRRSFDEMAEEMIRPMLQDWLDNNLPHLVERLVREEIERIARGDSR